MRTFYKSQAICKYGFLVMLFLVLFTPSFALSAPDLTVLPPHVSDSTLIPGQSYIISATVQNVGSTTSPATTLVYYLSTDSIIGPKSDTPFPENDVVDILLAGGSSEEDITANAPGTIGTYYVGACVGGVAGEVELSNQCSKGHIITVAPPAPDLVVTSPSTNISTFIPGQLLQINATVENQGTGTADATTLVYFLSTDSTIDAGDTAFVETDPISSLIAGAASAQNVLSNVPETPGTYWVGACVDAVAGESDTTNQCSSGVEINVVAPDLLVISPSVSASGLLTGESFTIYATVENQGTASASSTLRYFLSTDSTINTGDTELGTDLVANLYAASTVPLEATVSAPVTGGTYWVGACVDPVTNESDITNQCSGAVEINVTAFPDLVVISPGVSNTTLTPGQTFTISVTVENQGTAIADATTLRYYRSTNSIINTADTELTTDVVESLAASATSPQSSSITAPAAGGSYWVGACVDEVAEESSTTNQCSAGVEITVQAPDLVVVSPSVSVSDLIAGETFTIYATVENQGTDTSSATTLRYYLSTNSIITTSDTELTTDTVESLAASATSPQSGSATAPATGGSYWVGACVDEVVDEISTTNQCSNGVEITVPGPDLTVISPSVSVSELAAGETFTIYATVENQGTDTSSATTLRYYLSTNSTITTNDTELTTDAVESLAASGTSPQSGSPTAPATGGSYWVGACVDVVAGEISTTNQCSTGVEITVPGPDLVVTLPSTNESSLLTGQTVTMYATVENQGLVTADATTLRYFLSTNSTITINDTELTTDSVESLAAGATSPKDATVTVPPTPGTYWVGACVDAVVNEGTTDNQCSSGVEITIAAGSGPDLIVSSPSVSASDLMGGETFTISATANNQGTEVANATTIRFYLSYNSTIATNDIELTTSPVDGLAVGANSPQSGTSTAPLVTGNYWAGSCVDVVTGESDITNQCSSGVEISVTGPLLVTTQAVSSIEATTATGHGIVAQFVSTSPSQHGICWNTSGNPIISDGCTEGGEPIEGARFTGSITGLTAGTTYYVRAYATDNSGTAYGQQISFIAGASIVETFASPSPSGVGMDYDEARKGVWLAGEDGHLYMIDAVSHTTVRDIDLTDNVIANSAPGSDGIAVLANGNLLLTDYQGDLVYVDDHLYEFNPDTENIVNYWPLDGSWNTSTDGSSIDQVVGVEKGENGHVYVTSHVTNDIYELALIDGNPGSWSTVAVITAPQAYPYPTTDSGNAGGIDLICKNETGYRWIVSDWYSTNIYLLGEDFTEMNQISGAHGTNSSNSGVTIVPGNPMQMWVTDLTSDMIGIFNIRQIDCGQFSWNLFLPAIIGGVK